jgi:hypothetical protein
MGFSYAYMCHRFDKQKAIFIDKGKGSMIFPVENIENGAIFVWLKYCLGH